MHWCTKKIYPTSAGLKTSRTGRVAQIRYLYPSRFRRFADCLYTRSALDVWEIVFCYLGNDDGWCVYMYINVNILSNFQVEGIPLSLFSLSILINIYIIIYIWFAFAILPHLTSRNTETVWYNNISYNHHLRLCIDGNPWVPPQCHPPQRK